jgi:hypothetical protein
MPNYRETTSSGTSYTRAHTVIINNDLNWKNIEFQEERVFVLDGGETLNQRGGHLGCEFTPEAAATTFAVLDPETGSDLGVTSSYGEVYALLFSIYMHMVTERDDAEAAAIEAGLGQPATITPSDPIEGDSLQNIGEL